MKKIIILLTVLLVSVVGEAQETISWANEGDIIPTFVINQTRNAAGVVRNDTISRPDDWQEGFFEGTVKEFFEKPFNGLSLRNSKLHQCCVVPPFYKPSRFQAYLTNEGHWVRTVSGSLKDTIACKPRYSSFEENREYIKYLVTTAYYYGINRNASVRNKGYLKGLKVHQDLKKLLTAVDKSF